MSFFLRKNLNLMGRDGERIWKDLGKAVIKIYLDLNLSSIITTIIKRTFSVKKMYSNLFSHSSDIRQ